MVSEPPCTVGFVQGLRYDMIEHAGCKEDTMRVLFDTEQTRL